MFACLYTIYRGFFVNNLKRMSEHNIDNLRHSCAHLLAAAVLELYPQAKRTIGPPIEDGFYYDFDFLDEKISEEDLKKIEKKMQEILKSWKSFERHEISKEEALKMFENNEYKKELIEEISGEGQILTAYQSGDFTDLCRGGHCEEPHKQLQNFKLLKLAGAYWRGDEKNRMLTRIYGTCFETKDQLKEYLNMLEEAKKRDHRVLGKQLGLFTFSDLVGPGLPLWFPKGTIIRDQIDSFVWSLRKEKGYEKVTIPHITKKELYETSGHWDKYSADLFKVSAKEGEEDAEYALKPMNCPHHTQIFGGMIRSYRDMPQRFAETTMVYRAEQSGELSGLTRVLSITQDDAHVFCRESQLRQEIEAIWDIIDKFYGTFAFQLSVHLSFRDPKTPEKYLGDTNVWDRSEAVIEDIAKERGAKYELDLGEAAFYGPKLDFIARDSIGRKHQVATIQLDRNQPARFGLHCINEHGEEEQVVMIHAAIAGSLERFSAVLIEHLAGNFPLWLAPVQIEILPVSTEKHLEGAKKLADELSSHGLRVHVDQADETVGKKIRNSSKMKIPYVLVVGDKELSGNELTVRIRGQENQEDMSKDAFINRVLEEVKEKKA